MHITTLLWRCINHFCFPFCSTPGHPHLSTQKKQQDSDNQEAINLTGIILPLHHSAYNLLFKLQVPSCRIIFKISFKLPLVLLFSYRFIFIYFASLVFQYIFHIYLLLCLCWNIEPLIIQRKNILYIFLNKLLALR